jgi:hypothetical protein
MSDEWRLIILMAGLAAAGLLILAAAAELARQADRADQAAEVGHLQAWQVSQLLDNARRITAEAADKIARGEIP